MATTTIILTILLILAVILDIFLIIRVAVLRNYLHLFETRMGEIEARLAPKNKKELKDEQEIVRTQVAH